MGQRGAVIASELSDGFVALASSKHGKDGERKNGGEGMSLAMRGTGIRNLGKHF
jgi:hypothetical protein